MKASSLHFFGLLRTKILLSLQAEARRNHLSYAWWLLEPLFEAAVFYVVFAVFLSAGQENFVPFLLTGLIPWTWFSRSVSNSMTSLLTAQNFMINFKIFPAFFPLVELGQDLIKQGVTFSALVAILILFGIEPTLFWLGLPLAMLLQAMLVFSVGCFLAAIVPIVQDLKYVVATSLLAIMLASGIFYDPLVTVSEKWQIYFFANPVASMVQIYRDLLIGARLPEVSLCLIVLGWSLLISIFAGLALTGYQHRYARIIQE